MSDFIDPTPIRFDCLDKHGTVICGGTERVIWAWNGTAFVNAHQMSEWRCGSYAVIVAFRVPWGQYPLDEPACVDAGGWFQFPAGAMRWEPIPQEPLRGIA